MAYRIAQERNKNAQVNSRQVLIKFQNNSLKTRSAVDVSTIGQERKEKEQKKKKKRKATTPNTSVTTTLSAHLSVFSRGEKTRRRLLWLLRFHVQPAQPPPICQQPERPSHRCLTESIGITTIRRRRIVVQVRPPRYTVCGRFGFRFGFGFSATVVESVRTVRIIRCRLRHTDKVFL